MSTEYTGAAPSDGSDETAGHYSGLLILAKPGALECCAEEVESITGVEVHFLYPESSRLIAVQETGTAEEQEAGLRAIQNLPSVLSAAFVEHRIVD